MFKQYWNLLMNNHKALLYRNTLKIHCCWMEIGNLTSGLIYCLASNYCGSTHLAFLSELGKPTKQVFE